MTDDHSTLKLKPIETYWNGLRFRSRLEARWAVFYDYLGIKYEYEKEGYDLGDGLWYLPDFWLPEQELFIEVKPEMPEHGDAERSRTKAWRLALQSKFPVAVAYGNIGSIESSDWPNLHHTYWPYLGLCDVTEDSQWGRTARCGKFLLCGCRCGCESDFMDTENNAVLIAYRIARQIRFEEVQEPIWETFEHKEHSYAKRINKQCPDSSSRQASQTSTSRNCSKEGSAKNTP